MHLRRQLGLSSLPNEAASTLTSLPLAITLCNPVRGIHYAHIQVDTHDCNTPLRIIVSQKQQGQQQASNADTVTASDRGEDRGEGRES